MKKLWVVFVNFRLFFLAALIFVLSWAVVGQPRVGFEKPIPVPKEKLDQLPLTIGAWRGQAVGEIPHMTRLVGAALVLDRKYARETGETCFLHLAAFDNYRQLAPHHPEICYGGAGWETARRQEVQIPGGTAENPLRGEFIVFERKDEYLFVLYWYQIGSLTAYDPYAVRAAWWQVRNRPNPPPQLKVLLQTGGYDASAAREAFLELTGPIYQWVKESVE